MISNLKTLRSELKKLIIGYFALIRFNRKYGKSIRGYFPEIHIQYMNEWFSTIIQISYHKNIDGDECCLKIIRFCMINGFDKPKITTEGSREFPYIASDLIIDGEKVAYFRAFDILHCNVEVKEVPKYEIVSSCADVHNVN